MKTVYECRLPVSGVTPSRTELKHYASTEREALAWLEARGGGVYRNTLHNFECKVNPRKGA